MKKNIHLSFLLFVLSIVSVGSNATTFSTETRTCPVGSEIYTTEVLMSYSIFDRRLDLKPQGTYG